MNSKSIIDSFPHNKLHPKLIYSLVYSLDDNLYYILHELIIDELVIEMNTLQFEIDSLF